MRIFITAVMALAVAYSAGTASAATETAKILCANRFQELIQKGYELDYIDVDQASPNRVVHYPGTQMGGVTYLAVASMMDPDGKIRIKVMNGNNHLIAEDTDSPTAKAENKPLWTEPVNYFIDVLYKNSEYCFAVLNN